MLICTKIQLHLYFFFKISQIFCKIVILGTLGMSGHVDQDY